jgi:NADH-quinone oxidoreductase subunit G
VWFTKPVDAHCACDTCSGEVQLWMRGDEVLRVTARKDEWGEVKQSSKGTPGWICNKCRFEKKKVSDWVIEEPSKVNRHSVISQGHYEHLQKPSETMPRVMGGRDPKLLMDIKDISEVNQVDLSKINGPATSLNYKPTKNSN